MILISETSSGLQNCPNRLQSYCRKSKLSANIEKNRTMKVSKRQHSVQHHFTFANKPLDTCKSYTYLGSLISDNDNLKLNINEIFRSASRAMYNLLGNANKHLSDNVYILTELFDKMILPICTYNWEV